MACYRVQLPLPFTINKTTILLVLQGVKITCHLETGIKIPQGNVVSNLV